MSSGVGFLLASDFPEHIKVQLLQAIAPPGCEVCAYEAHKALVDMGIEVDGGAV